MHRSPGWAFSSVVEGPGYSVKVQFHIVHAIFSLSVSLYFMNDSMFKFHEACCIFFLETE